MPPPATATADGHQPPPPPPPAVSIPSSSQQSFPSKVNDFLHRDYITDLAFYGFWLAFWLIMPPYIFLGTLAMAVYDLFTIKGYRAPCGPVLITACDKGFGKDLALCLAAKGWKVIAACNTEEGVHMYADTKDIQAVKMDMSSDADVQALAETLSIQLGPEGLYALVNNNNNTVVGQDGMIEWVTIDNYKSQMEINLYSFIRVTHTFLPLLKKHVRADPKHKARIVTLNSNAGVVPGQPNASCYAAAKHACDGWMSSLRIEAKVWGIDVACVSPSWHNIEIDFFDYDLFASLPPSMQEEYGREYCNLITEGATRFRNHISWRPENVTHALMHAVTAGNQRQYVVVGMDGRFVANPLLLLPRRIYNNIMDSLRGFHRHKPQALLHPKGTDVL